MDLEGWTEMKGKGTPERDISKGKYTNSAGKWSPTLVWIGINWCVQGVFKKANS